MSVIQAIILGIIQGGTEFFPISSSGHLALYSALFKWPSPTLALAVALHMGTLLAVVLYYRNDVLRLILGFFSTFRSKDRLRAEERLYVRLFWMLVVAMIPAGVVGLLFSEQVDKTFSRPNVAAHGRARFLPRPSLIGCWQLVYHGAPSVGVLCTFRIFDLIPKYFPVMSRRMDMVSS